MVVAVLALVATLGTLPGSAGARQAMPEAAAGRWRTVHRQGFEGSFPPAPPTKWAVADYNGPSAGPAAPNNVWDDNGIRAHSGSWSASPANDLPTYGNLTDTWMRYGPFSLTGASNARMSFWYWLESEENYDFFGWEYTCTGLTRWTSVSISGTSDTADAGSVPNWRKMTLPLGACAGRPEVYVRFTFRSDLSGTYAGVNLDDILIQKFS
jgi:hypothetical protein